MAHPVTHENFVTSSYWFGIGIAIGIGIGFGMHRIPIAIPIPIIYGLRLFSKQFLNSGMPFFFGSISTRNLTGTQCLCVVAASVVHPTPEGTKFAGAV
jgi:hypothetical protein